MIKVLLIVGYPRNSSACQMAAELIRLASPTEFRFTVGFFGQQSDTLSPRWEKSAAEAYWFPAPEANSLLYLKALTRLIRDRHFSVIHLLTSEDRGMSLLAASQLGVPIRIAHTLPEDPAAEPRKSKQRPGVSLLFKCATHFISADAESGAAVFGRKSFARKGVVLRFHSGSDSSASQQKSELHSGEHGICRIYRDLASVSLSFDDGRGDNTEVADQLLLPMGIPATLNISTGYVDGSCPDQYLPTRKPPMTIRDIQRLAKDPLIEIAMHGDFHLNTDEDIFRGRKKLLDWLKLEKDARLGFASPSSGLSPERFCSPQEAKLRKSILYFRTSLRISSRPLLRVLCRKAARVLHLPFLFRIAYHDTVMCGAEGQIIYSVPVMKGTTAGEVMALVRSAVKRRGAVVLLLHSIRESTAGEDNWSWKRRKLLCLCKRLSALEQQGMLCMCTTARLHDLLQSKEQLHSVPSFRCPKEKIR